MAKLEIGAGYVRVSSDDQTELSPDAQIREIRQAAKADGYTIPPEFIFIDRGCIVNIIHIMKISDGMAVLKNGEQLPISRSHLQEVKQKINEFWGAHI